MQIRVLIVNEFENDSSRIVNALNCSHRDFLLQSVANLDDYRHAVQEQHWDYVISNACSASFSPDDVIKISRQNGACIKNIIITGKTAALQTTLNNQDFILIDDDNLNQLSDLIVNTPHVPANNARFHVDNVCNERMWELLNNSFNEIFVFDIDKYQFSQVNQTALQNLGYSLKEIFALKPYELVENQSKQSFEKLLAPLVNGVEKLLHFDAVLIRKDNTRYPVDARILLNEEGSKKHYYAIVVDISERMKTNQEIKTLARFPEDNPSPVIRLAPDASVLYYNPASKAIVNFWSELFDSTNPEHWQQWIEDCINGDGVFDFEETIEHKVYHWQLSAAPDKSYVYCYGRDITKEKTAEHDLIQAGQVFEHSTEGIMITDNRNRIIRVNPAFSKITGYTELEVLGKDPSLLRSGNHSDEFFKDMWLSLSNSGRWQSEIWNKRKNGEIYPEFLTINVIKNSIGETANYICVFADITERKEAQENLYRLAYYDSLTELPNRFHTQERLALTLKKAKHNNHTLAVIHLDVKRFKQINETLGHTLADHIVELIACRLTEALPSDVFLGRLAGDEFLIIAKNRYISDEHAPLVQTIEQGLEAPFNINGQDIYVSVCLGVAHYPNDGDNVEVLLQRAETALAHAKRDDKNLEIFSSELEMRGIKHISLESNLRKALEREEFILHYQPQFELSSNKVVGAEALIRWQHPTNGLVPPIDFIPLLEETGLIIPVGDWVIQKACQQIVEWSSHGIAPPRVAINISAKQFNQKNLTENVIKIIQQSGVKPECLELEVTESTIMRNFDHVINVLTQLHNNNILLSVDDFGTGYSSLSYLKHFPIDVLKIDRSFVREIPQNIEDTAIVNTIISMGHNMNLKVIAEGVETLEQRNCLSNLGCELAQGFYFSRPLPADEFLNFIKQHANY